MRASFFVTLAVCAVTFFNTVEAIELQPSKKSWLEQGKDKVAEWQGGNGDDNKKRSKLPNKGSVPDKFPSNDEGDEGDEGDQGDEGDDDADQNQADGNTNQGEPDQKKNGKK